MFTFFMLLIRNTGQVPFKRPLKFDTQYFTMICTEFDSEIEIILSYCNKYIHLPAVVPQSQCYIFALEIDVVVV